jgi:hypothetical protein
MYDSENWQVVVDWKEATGPFPGDVLGPELERRGKVSRTATVYFDAYDSYHSHPRMAFLPVCMAVALVALILLIAIIARLS